MYPSDFGAEKLKEVCSVLSVSACMAVCSVFCLGRFRSIYFDLSLFVTSNFILYTRNSHTHTHTRKISQNEQEELKGPVGIWSEKDRIAREKAERLLKKSGAASSSSAASDVEMKDASAAAESEEKKEEEDKEEEAKAEPAEADAAAEEEKKEEEKSDAEEEKEDEEEEEVVGEIDLEEELQKLYAEGDEMEAVDEAQLRKFVRFVSLLRSFCAAVFCFLLRGGWMSFFRFCCKIEMSNRLSRGVLFVCRWLNVFCLYYRSIMHACISYPHCLHTSTQYNTKQIRAGAIEVLLRSGGLCGCEDGVLSVRAVRRAGVPALGQHDRHEIHA